MIPKRLISPKQYSLLTAKQMVEELGDRLDEQETMIGKEATQELIGNILMLLIGSSIGKALKVEDPMAASKKELVEIKYQQFKAMKSIVEQAAGMGVSSAMTLFMGSEAEFWCQISPVPKPVNKQPC